MICTCPCCGFYRAISRILLAAALENRYQQWKDGLCGWNVPFCDPYVRLKIDYPDR